MTTSPTIAQRQGWRRSGARPVVGAGASRSRVRGYRPDPSGPVPPNRRQWLVAWFATWPTPPSSTSLVASSTTGTGCSRRSVPGPAAASTSPTTSGCAGGWRSRSCTGPSPTTAGFLRRFRAEAQMAAALHHPHVMAVYDWGEDDGVAVHGARAPQGRLAASHARHRQPPHPRAGDARRPAGRGGARVRPWPRASSTATSSPANLLFDAHGIVRVADFGLARALAEASWTEPAGSARRHGARTSRPNRPAARRSTVAPTCTPWPSSSSRRARARRPSSATPRSAPSPHAPTDRSRDPRSSAHSLRSSRAGKPDPTQRYADAGAMGAALAAAGRVLPAPEPLTLPGIGDVVVDEDQTRHGPNPLFFDQDTATANVDARPTRRCRTRSRSRSAPDESQPRSVHRRGRHRRRPRRGARGGRRRGARPRRKCHRAGARRREREGSGRAFDRGGAAHARRQSSHCRRPGRPRDRGASRFGRVLATRTTRSVWSCHVRAAPRAVARRHRSAGWRCPGHTREGRLRRRG